MARRPVRLEAVLPQPVSDRGGVLADPAADLRERETLIKKPLKASSVHTKILSVRPDGKANGRSYLTAAPAAV